jgi:hypothetical protein
LEEIKVDWNAIVALVGSRIEPPSALVVVLLSVGSKVLLSSKEDTGVRYESFLAGLYALELQHFLK